MRTNIDRNDARMIAAAVQRALADLEDDLGVKLEVKGNWRFSSSSVSLNVEARLDVPLEKTAEGRIFAAYAPRFGLEKDDLGKTFWSGNGRSREQFKITGLKTSRPKYPVSAECVRDGRAFKFTAGQVQEALGRPVSRAF